MKPSRPARTVANLLRARRPWRRALRVSRSPRAVYRLLSLTPLGAAVAVVAGLPPITAWAQATGNVIKPDGRTATQQQVQGTRTDITTGTVRGDNGFNSFSRFEVGQGQTVNVHVPTQAQRVINIVTDAPIKVDGVLNGLKDGSLNGNLVFADPMGMVVSRSGVINVNSLQVVAPTRAHLDAMLDGQGRVGDAAVKQLLDGQAPRSAEGRVQIDGRINALERVRIEARRIDVEGRIKAGVDAAHDAAFRAAVSSNGLNAATGMVERGGVIELVADEAVAVKGTLDASQRQALTLPMVEATAGQGGQVVVQAREITLAADSLVDVSGLQGGGVALIGTMSLPSVQPLAADAPVAAAAPATTQSLVVAKGSRVEADAVERGHGGKVQYLSDGSLDFGGFAGARGGALMGNGGFVEVSGRRRLQLYGLVDTRAPKGLGGTLLIDPDALYISNGAAGDSSCLGTTTTGDCSITTGTVLGLAASNSNLVLQANDSITLGDAAGNAATLDLSDIYRSHGSGIAFTSQAITFNANSKLITGGGDVKLVALGGQSTGDFGSGEFKYSNSVGLGPLTLGEKVQGGAIHLKSGAAVITRGVAAGKDAASDALVRNAGDVTLRGGSVLLDAGAQILAQAESGSTFTGGAVELTAYAKEQYHLGKATATSQVTLAGTVKADSIAVNSVAQAEATPDGAFGYAVEYIQAALGALTGMGAGYHETQADARIEVQGTARIEAKTTLDFAAASYNKAAGSVKVYTVDEKDNQLAALGAIYVRTGGVADVSVRSGAQLKSGGKTTVGAFNDATAKADVNILSTNAIGGAAVSYMVADVSSNAQIDAGATLNVGALDLVALQTGNMRNTAQAKIERREAKNGEPPPPDAAIGATVAISDISAHSTAKLGASLTGVADVNVVSDTSLWQNMTSASNSVVPVGAVDKIKIAAAQKFLPFASLQGKLTGWLSDKFDALGSLKSGSPPIKAGATVTVNETDLGSSAQIGNGASVTSSGNVAVVAQTEDRSIHNISNSKVNTKESTEAKPAISAAVAVGLYTHDALATVGEGATVSAKNFGLQSQVYQPLDVTWLASFSVDGLKNPAELVTHFTPPNFGMPQFVFTSWASALSEQEPANNSGGQENTQALSGAVNWTSFKNTSKAWVGAGAKITASAGDQAWSIAWAGPKAPLLDGDSTLDGEAAAGAVNNVLVETSEVLDQIKGLTKNAIGEITGFFNGKPVVTGITLNNSASFDKAVDVKGLNQSAFLTFTGQPIDIGFSGVKLGVQGGPVAAGGAFNYAGAEHTTVAGVDDGAVVKATLGTVSVEAESQDRIIAIAPSAGKGKGAAVNLIAAYSQLDNTTVAVLSNKAQVEANALDVKAIEDVSVWSAAGAAAFGASAAAVGVAVAVNELDGRTVAAIADPGSLAVGAVRPDGFSGRSATGSVDVVELRVQGLTQGTSGAIAASAAEVSSEDQSKADDQVKQDDKSALSKKWESLKTKTSDLRSKAVTKISSDGTGTIAGWRNKLADKIAEKQEATVPPKPPKQSSVSLAAAGSSTVNLGNLDTSALLDGAVLANKHAKSGSDTSLLLVRADNNTHQYSVSGSLALAKMNAPETNQGYGVSGAIAIDMEDNDTLARINASSVKDYGTVSVESLASGQRIAVGLGIAGSSGSKPAYMLGVSYSMTESDNSTVSAIDGGSISGSEAFRSAVEVLAYDKTETGVGAGALTVQRGKGGAAGASVGVALIHNEVEARLAGTQATQLSTLDVRAYDPVVLGIGAASLGISNSENSATLEGSVTYGEVENTTRARIGDSLTGTAANVEASGRVTVQATDIVPAAYKSRFDAVLAADGTPAGDADYDFGASLRSGSQDTFGGQSIGSSQPGSLIIGVAGGVAIGAKTAAGAALAVSRVANVHEALLEGATVGADSLKVDATDGALLVNVGVGVAATNGKLALAGSVAITIDENRATARIGGSSGKTTSVTAKGQDGLSVTAAASERAFAVAGSLGVSTNSTAGGLAGTVGVNTGVAEAQIQGASITASSAQVLGTTASQHVSVAAAGGYGKDASINGSFVINFSTERTSATVSDSTVTADSLAVKAGDDAALAAQVYTGAGSIGFSSGVAGGAALTSNTVALTREAAVDRSSLTLGQGIDALEVQADSSVKMIGVTLAGGGSKDVAFNGAISSNEIANTTTARMAGNQLTSTGDVRVIAGDRSEMNYGTGAIGFGSEVAIGAAISSNIITSDITAVLQGTDANGNKRDSGILNAGNVRVSATSDERIVNAAYGVSISGELAGAGSIAVNVIDTDVKAHIGRGADLHADGTVAVQATAQDDIKSFGGAAGLSGATGVGLSSTVNVVRGGTEASVGADGEAQVQIDAKGNGAGQAVNGGSLASALPGMNKPGEDPTRFNGMNAMQSYDVGRAKMSETQSTVKGLAVNATSMRHVLSFDTTAGIGGDLGIGANADAHVISSATTAEIANAKVNQRDAGAAEQDVAVKASSHHVMASFGLGLGVGTGAGAGSLGGDVFLTQTNARIRDSQTKAARDVSVRASNESAQSGLLAGLAAGGSAFAGTVGVVVFDAGVEAAILGGRTRAERDVSVDAGNASVLNVVSGAGSFSGGLALAGAITVVVSDTDTHAYIGRENDTGQATKVSSGRNVDVQADSSNAINTFTFAASGGAATSVAAIGAVAVVTNETTAEARHADLEVGVAPNWVLANSNGDNGNVGETANPVTVGGPAAGKLSIEATDHGLINQVSGAAAISFVGGGAVGGTVSVLVAKSNVAAVLKSSEVDTKDLDLHALNSQDQLAATVGVGGSADVGVGFAISLTMTGTGRPDAEAFDGSSAENSKGSQLVARAAQVANANRLGETGGVLSSSERATLQAQSRRDISGTLRDSGSNSAASAIEASTVRAAGDVGVRADQETALKNIAGAGGFGLLVGAGGSVGVSYVYNATAAEVSGSTVTAGGALNIIADSGDKAGKQALDLLTVAGGAGFAGLGASVGIGHLENHVTVQADGTLTAGALSLSASDSTSAKAENVAAAAGGGALGIAVSSIERAGAVTAWVNPAGASGTSVTARTLDVTAEEGGSADVVSRAVAAGLAISGNGAAGLIKDSMSVKAGIGDASIIHVSGDPQDTSHGTQVLAQRRADLDGRAEGVGVSGGVQLGGSVAEVTLLGETVASVGKNVLFDASGALAVAAEENSASALAAKATASGGGWTASLNASVATAENKASTRASIGDGTLLPDADVTLVASHAATQSSDASGVTVGGLLALGANVAETKTWASSEATLGNVKTSGQRLGDLTVSALGSDTSKAKSMAGGGGLISGQAAVATVDDKSRTAAEISDWGATALAHPQDYTLHAGKAILRAQHVAQFRTDSDTINASVVGGSGALAYSTVDNEVSTKLGEDVRLRALGIGLAALNQATEIEGGDNAAGAGGGLANGSAVQVKTHVDSDSTTTVGQRAQLEVFGDPTSESAGRLVVEAGNELLTHSQGSLNTGGLIDVPFADVESISNAHNQVTVGANAQLRSVGDLVLGTTAMNRMQATSTVKTYGGVSVAGGTSLAKAQQSDSIVVDTGALLHAYGNVSVSTGRNALGGLNLVSSKAETDVYNYTAVPITTTNAADALTVTTGTVNLAAGSQIEAGRSVFLRNFKGDQLANARGEGHNPYLEIFSTSTDDSDAGQSFIGNMLLNGKVTAGYYRLRDMTIAADGTLTQTTDLPALQLPVKVFTMDAQGQYRDAANQPVDASAVLKPQGYIAKVEGFNPNLYYDDNAKAKLGGVPDKQMGAYVLPDLFAAGGSIEVNATLVSGNGELRAQGGPLLQLKNASNRYVIANRMVMPDEDSGGAVSFTGSGAKPAGLTVAEVDKGRVSAISLLNSFDPGFGGGDASDIVFQAGNAGEKTVRNPRGSFTLINSFGNVWGGSPDALTVDIQVPQGTYVLESTGYEAIGGSPQNEWANWDSFYRPNDIAGFVDTVAYGYYVQRLGKAATGDAVAYSKDLQGIVNDKGKGITGYLFRKNLGNIPDADHALEWYESRYEFDVLPVKTLADKNAGAKPGSSSPGLTANRVDITAKYLDINAPIRAGTARDIDVTIKDAKLYRADYKPVNGQNPAQYNFYDCVANPSCRVVNGLYAEANGLYKVPVSSLAYGANSPQLTVMYDAASGRLSTAGIGSSSAGAVTLVGHILNSNANGTSKIELATGTLKVNLQNQSGHEIDLPRIETGATGKGVIRITDLADTATVYNPAAKKNVQAPLTTWYVSADGKNVEMYQDRLASDYAGLTAVTSGSNGATLSQYAPAAGWRYQWTRSATATRQLKAPAGGGAWWDWYATDWEFANGVSSAPWALQSTSVIKDTSRVGINYDYSLSASAGFNGVNVGYSYKGEASRTWQVATRATLSMTSSVKADFGIGIGFQGYADGSVTIGSNANAYLGKSISNSTGDTAITLTGGAKLLGHDGGLLKAKNLTLNVAGDIGGDGASRAVDVQLGGTLKAKSGGNLAINALGDLHIEQAEAGKTGTLSLHAVGDLTASGQGVQLKGYGIELLSTSGRIGGSGTDDALNLQFFNIGKGALQRGVLTAEANGDVKLAISGGDVRVNSVKAADGNVKIATDGSLFDYKEGAGAIARSADDLLALWEGKLRISGDRAEAVKDMLVHTIAPLDQQVNRDYRAYWDLRALGQLDASGKLLLSAQGLGTLRAQTAAALSKPAPTDAEVNSWANTLLARYTTTFDTLLGKNAWQTRPEFQARNAGYRFSADRYNEYWQLLSATDAKHQLTPAGKDAVRAIAATVLGGSPSDVQLQAYVDQRFSVLGKDFAAALGGGWAGQAAFKSYDAAYQFAGDTALLATYATGNYWGQDKLENSVRLAALGNPGGGGTGAVDHLNISGRKVEITSSSGKATLGRDNGYRTINLGQALSEDDRYALSLANAPGDVKTLTNSLGQVIGLQVRDNRPVFVSASQQLDADVRGQLFVQAQGALVIGQVKSDGRVRLLSQDGITQAAAGTAPQITASALVLDGGQGGLGTSSAPLTIKAGELSLAKASEGIYLNQVDGSLTLDLVSSAKDVEINVAKGSLLQKQPDLLSLAGRNIKLTASGDIGADLAAGGHALHLQTHGGALSLDAGSAWLITSGITPLNLGASELDGALNLSALGTTGVTMSGDVKVGGAAQLLVGGAFASADGKKLDVRRDLSLTAQSVVMGQGSELRSGEGRLDLASSGGDALLGTLSAKTGMAVDAEQGQVLVNADGIKFTVTDAGGLLSLNGGNSAGQGLGTAQRALLLAADKVALRSGSGDIAAELMNAQVELQDSQVERGALSLKAHGGLSMSGDVRAATAARIEVAGDFAQAAGTSLTAGDALSLDAKSIAMGAGARMASDRADIALQALDGDARLGTLQAVTGIAIDAAKGRVLRVATGDVLAASGANAPVTLNAHNSGGLGLGTAAEPLIVKAARVGASSAKGGIYLQLPNAQSQVDQALGGTGDIVLQADGDLKLAGPVASDGAVTVRAIGALDALDRIEALGAGHDLLLQAASMELAGTMSAGGNARLVSDSGDLLIKGSGAHLKAGGSAELVSAKAMELHDVEAGLDITIDAGGPVNGQRVVAGRVLTVLRAPEFKLDELRSGADMSLSLGNADIRVLGAGGALQLRAGQAALGQISVGRDATLIVQGGLNIGSGSVGGSLTASASGMGIGNLGVGGGASLSAGSVSIGSLSAGSIAIGAGSLNAVNLSASGALDVNAGDADLGSVGAGGAALLRIGSTLGLEQGRFGASLDLGAGAATLGDVEVSGGTRITVVRGLEIGSLWGKQGLSVAADSIDADLLRAGGSLELAARTASLAELRAESDARLAIVGALSLVKADVTGKLTLKADSLESEALKVGGDLALQAGEAALGDLNVGGASVLNASRALTQTGGGKLGGSLQAEAPRLSLGSLEIAGAVQLHADALQARSLQIGNTLALQAQDAKLAALAVKGVTDLQVAGLLEIGQGRFDDQLNIKSGSLGFGDVRSSGKTVLSVADSAKLGSFEAQSTLDVTARDLQADALKVGGALTLQARNAAIAQGQWLGTADLRVAEALSLSGLKGQQAITLQSHSLTGGDWNLASTLGVKAHEAKLGVALSVVGAADFDIEAALQIDKAQFGSSLHASAATMQLGQVEVGGDTSLKASGQLQAQRLAVGGRLDAQAPQLLLGTLPLVQPAADPAPTAALIVKGAVALAADELSVGNADIGGAAQLRATRTLTMKGSSHFAAGLQAEADNMELDALSVSGGAAALSSKTAMKIGQFGWDGTATLQAQTLELGQLDGKGALEMGANSLKLAGLKSSSGDLKLAVADAADLGKLELGGKALVQVGKRLAVESLSSIGDVDLQADQLALGNVSAGGQLALRAAQDLVGDSLKASQTAQLQAGGAITAKLVDASTLSLTAVRDIQLDMLKATQAEISTPTQIALREGHVADSVVFKADRIQAGLVGGNGTLRTTVSGQGEAAASNVALNVDMPGRWVLPSFKAINAQLGSSGRWVQFDQASLSGIMSLTTPDGLIVMDNDKITPVPTADVQLYAPSGNFVLLRDRQYVYTTALALIYKPGQFVSAPNTLLSPLISAQSNLSFGATPGLVSPALSLRRLAGLDLPSGDPEELLRQNPTASGQEEELVGTLEF